MKKIDKNVKIYIDELGHWVPANDDWSFESGRYHWEDRLDIKEASFGDPPTSTKTIKKKSTVTVGTGTTAGMVSFLLRSF